MGLPKKGVAYTFPLQVGDKNVSGTFKVNPTIAAGDFQVSKDGAAFANLATLPVVTPAGSSSILISLSVTEMGADKVEVVGKDVTGNEWFDVEAFLDLIPYTIDDIFALLANNSNVVLEGDGSRTITIFEDDGTTVQNVMTISPDGLVRTRTT